MKRSVKALALALSLLMVLGALVSCGGKTLSGVYTWDATVETVGVKSGAVTTLEFSGNKITKTLKTYVVGNVTSTDVWEGTYEIDDSTDPFEISICYTVKNGETLEEADTDTLSFFEDGETGDIKLGLLVYKKQ